MADRLASQGQPDRRLASVSWAEEQAGISRSVAYCWARSGRLPGCVEMGGRYYVRVAPFLRWLDGSDGALSPVPDGAELGAARDRRGAGTS